MREVTDLQEALMDAVDLMNRPRFHAALLERAGVSLDRALFPLLSRIGARGRIGVVELAGVVNLGHSTVSRQLAKLESLGLITRTTSPDDQRVKEAEVTAAGKEMLAVLRAARRRGLDELLSTWDERDVDDLARLLRRFTDTIRTFPDQHRT